MVKSFQTYWERSTNSVCIENILIPSCNERNPCPQDRPSWHKLLHLDHKKQNIDKFLDDIFLCITQRSEEFIIGPLAGLCGVQNCQTATLWRCRRSSFFKQQSWNSQETCARWRTSWTQRTTRTTVENRRASLTMQTFFLRSARGHPNRAEFTSEFQSSWSDTGTHLEPHGEAPMTQSPSRDHTRLTKVISPDVALSLRVTSVHERLSHHSYDTETDMKNWDSMRYQINIYHLQFPSHLYRHLPVNTRICRVDDLMTLLFACRSVSRSTHHVLVLGGLANISQHESAYMKAHTWSPVSTRRSNHAAYSNSPRTDNGNGVGANMSSLTVVSKSFSTSRPHFTPLQSSSPTCEQNRFVGRYASLLDPRVQLQIFHLLDFPFISSLDFVGGQSVDQGSFVGRSICQVFVRPSFRGNIKFHTILITDVKNNSPLVPSSTCFHRPLVLFESCPHPFGSPGSHCLSQRLFFWPLRVGTCWTRTRVQRSCVRISTNSTFRLLRWYCSAAIFPGVLIRLAFTSVWLPQTGSLTCRFRVLSLSSHFMHVFFWRRCRWMYCGNFHRCRCCRHLFIWTCSHRWSRYSRVHFHVKIPLRPSSFDRFTSAALLSTRLSAVWSELKQTMLRPHQVFIRLCGRELVALGTRLLSGSAHGCCLLPQGKWRAEGSAGS